MKGEQTGGAAFPRPAKIGSTVDNCYETAQEGMTLLDYFAAKALNGILKRAERMPTPADAALRAYEYADAMIAERNQR